jgi:hypothetical protein
MTEVTPLQKALRNLKGNLTDTTDVAKAVGDGNEPSQTDRDAVSAYLDDVQSELETIHDPGQSPSLVPPSAGSAQHPTIPDSRLQTCQDAETLAAEAESEAGEASPDYTCIGDRTRTLEASYLDAIRDRFGIE